MPLQITPSDFLPNWPLPQIQAALINIQGDTMIREAIRSGAREDLAATIQMIKDQCRDGHRVAIVDMVGESTVLLIDSV